MAQFQPMATGILADEPVVVLVEVSGLLPTPLLAQAQ
jgi:hypothetical protein